MAFDTTSSPLYSSFIHKSRYARFKWDEKKREDWIETVERWESYWLDRYPQYVEDIHEAAQAIFNLEVMPSMRSLMTAGTALDRDNVAGYNPVTGDTLVVTKEFGSVPISDLEGKEATVLNIEGKWVKAIFRGYGKQPIHKVILRLNSNTVKEVTCTSNHRWVKQNGKVVSTEALKPGDRINFVSAPKPKVDDDYYLGIKHGLIYGDGTATKTCNRVKGYLIRLCGEDNHELLEYFSGYPVSYPPSAGGDPIIYLYDGFAATHELKELPSPQETDSYLLGFVRGWLAADGSVTKNSQVSLCVSGEGKKWLSKNAERIGFTIQRQYKQTSETNYGKRKQESWIIYFSRSSMVDEDFLCSWKKSNFKSLKSHWVVKSIEPEEYEKHVYCAEVEDTNTFVLDGGLVTGNCSFSAVKGRGKSLSIFNKEMEDAGFDEPITIQVKNPIVFDEIFYILLCGTGVGFSVERQNVQNLPTVNKKLDRNIYRRSNKNYPGVSKDELSFLLKRDNTIFVADSKYGWASALRVLIVELYNGNFDIKWNVDSVRPKGSILKTFGGRSSGPEPLVDLFSYTVNLFRNAADRKLTSLEVHSLVCKIASIVVVGGVRRSALISLSNLSDDRMRHAKSGEWWLANPEFALANNSACYTEKPDAETFIREWTALIESKSGERGIFNREASKKQAKRNKRRDINHDFGTNPCSEIVLRDQQFCNLSEVVIRADDTSETLSKKVRVATFIGTLQATLTDFKYLNPEWRKNTEEEALLGVSLTGIMDHAVLNRSETPFWERAFGEYMNTGRTLDVILQELRDIAIETNERWARNLGIKQATAITCVKPSGTVSQLVDSASGIHARHNQYYIRTVRNDVKDPISRVMIESGVPYEVDLMNPSNYVFSFPIKAPDNCITRKDTTAIEQLELWKIYQEHWCEHKPSVTITVKDHEWLEVGAWVYKNFDIISGVSFLPYSEHTYQQAPYQDITEEEYLEAVAKMPKEIDWSLLTKYEEEDMTIGSQEYACSGGSCEIL